MAGVEAIKRATAQATGGGGAAAAPKRKKKKRGSLHSAVQASVQEKRRT